MSPADSPSSPRSSNHPSHRIAALDWMRGFVMVLMAIDHASQTWNAGRFSADSAYLLDPATGAPAWIPGSELDPSAIHLDGPTSGPVRVGGHVVTVGRGEITI